MKYFQEYENYRKKKESIKVDSVWYWLEETAEPKTLMKIIDVSHNLVRYTYINWRVDPNSFTRTLTIFLESAAPYSEKETNETV